MKICRPDPKDVNRISYLMGEWNLHVYVREPSADLGIMVINPGSVSPWNWWHDEVHYALKGECEFHYSLPPSHNKKEKVTLKAGDFYLIYKGTYGEFRNTSNEPYNVIFTVMPVPKDMLTGMPGA